MNWLSYIQDNPNIAHEGVMRYVAGGGAIHYIGIGYNGIPGAYRPETRDASLLVRTSANPITYERRLPDGGREIYGRSNGATTNPRRIFLTKILDRFGNALTLTYDGQLRLTKLTDATGRNTTFAYELTARPLLVTKITDPFGRSAKLQYDAAGRLSKITDVLGLTSEFAYDAASLITAMTTLYGTTRFAYGGDGNFRWLNATDPLGRTERVEFRHEAPGVPRSEPANTIPQGILSPVNEVIDARNSFYWDKHAYALAGSDYTKARITHWTHVAMSSNLTADTVESIKLPFENRVWFNYPGQGGPLGSAISGTLDKPTRRGRVLDDGRTQLNQMEYNAVGHLTRAVDPQGRERLFEYDTNEIDLLRVRQKTSVSGYSTIAEFTYNAHHLPLTYTDAAGQTSSYMYNSAGQLLQSTNPLGQVTRIEYDALGYLVTIVNANNQTLVAFTYDGLGRIATRVDSEGHRVRFTYDALDRITTETYPTAQPGFMAGTNWIWPPSLIARDGLQSTPIMQSVNWVRSPILWTERRNLCAMRMAC